MEARLTMMTMIVRAPAEERMRPSLAAVPAEAVRGSEPSSLLSRTAEPNRPRGARRDPASRTCPRPSRQGAADQTRLPDEGAGAASPSPGHAYMRSHQINHVYFMCVPFENPISLCFLKPMLWHLSRCRSNI